MSALQRLETAYQDALRKIDVTLKDEDARRLRLQIVLLETENDDLHEQLDLADDRIDMLEHENAGMQEQLTRTEKDLSRYEDLFKAQTREIGTLKDELVSMHGITTNSTRFLSEKLALQREIATLKPEIDHLRTQMLNFQAVLSEKLALQRQVNSLELELETARLASRRASQKSEEHAREQSIRKEAEELQRELTLERQQRERDRAESQRQMKALRSQITTLENELYSIRAKLRDTQEELKDCRTGFDQAMKVMAKAESVSIRSQAASQHPSVGVLDLVAEFESGTCNTAAFQKKRPNARGRKVDQTILGEKSMFSITPYLRRTLDVMPIGQAEGAALEPADLGVLKGGDSLDSSPFPLKAPKRRNANQRSMKNDNADGILRSEVDFERAESRTPTVPNAINNIIKSNNVSQMSSYNNGSTSLQPMMAHQSLLPPKRELLRRAGYEEPKRKKRKLLGNGKPLLNDDDCDAARRPISVAYQPRRNCDTALHKTNSEIEKRDNVLKGVFSPLKRDRRKVGTSFLQ